MNISELLKQHQLWLDKARTSMESRRIEAKDLEIPLEIKRQRAEEIGRQIDGLGLQKNNAVEHYDAAIAKNKAELERLNGEIARTEKLVRVATTSADDLFRQAQKAAEEESPMRKKQETARQPSKGPKK